MQLSGPKPEDVTGWGCAAQAPTVRLVRNTATGARLRVLLINPPAEPVQAAAFEDPYHQRWRIQEAFRRLKRRLRQKGASGLSQHALVVDVAAEVIADNITVLVRMAAQVDTSMPASQRSDRTHADAAVLTILPGLLLAIGDVLSRIDQTFDRISRTGHRPSPGRSAPRDPDWPKLHARISDRAGGGQVRCTAIPPGLGGAHGMPPAKPYVRHGRTRRIVTRTALNFSS